MHSITCDSAGDLYCAEVSFVEVGRLQTPNPREMVRGAGTPIRPPARRCWLGRRLTQAIARRVRQMSLRKWKRVKN